MKLSHIMGSFSLLAPAPEERCVDHVARALFLALSMEKPGMTTRHQNTINYRRGFDVGQWAGTVNWTRLAAFDPVNVSVDRCERGILVKYEFGFSRFYKFTSFILICLALLYFYGGSLKIVLIFFMIYLASQIGSCAWSTYKIHKWLKNVAVNSIRHFLENEDIEKSAVVNP